MDCYDTRNCQGNCDDCDIDFDNLDNNGYFLHLCEISHNALIEEKKKQGYHAPTDCPDRMYYEPLESISKMEMFCSMCDTEMLPFNELPDSYKELEKVRVKAVIEEVLKL